MATEAEAIDRSRSRSNGPVTRASLAGELRALGATPGCTLLVHSSLSALGWVVGGAQTVVEALLDCVGATGTLVVPTQSGQLSDPAQWSDPAVPAEWIPTVRDELPIFDPHLTTTRQMGKIADTLRQHPESIRGPHPTLSFAAVGPEAERIVAGHSLEDGMGDGSPLGRLYELDALVLLLGVGHGNNTSLHLAEHRADWAGKATVSNGAPMLVEGERRWVVYDDLDRDDADFGALGAAFAAAGAESSGPVGCGVARLMGQRALVDFAVDWISSHR